MTQQLVLIKSKLAANKAAKKKKVNGTTSKLQEEMKVLKKKEAAIGHALAASISSIGSTNSTAHSTLPPHLRSTLGTEGVLHSNHGSTSSSASPASKKAKVASKKGSTPKKVAKMKNGDGGPQPVTGHWGPGALNSSSTQTELLPGIPMLCDSIAAYLNK